VTYFISSTGSRPQVEHKFITHPDTLLAKQHIEKDTRYDYKEVIGRVEPGAETENESGRI
jgi:hypothetical protein